MQRTLPVAALLILILLAGCINWHLARIYTIAGIIRHENSDIPVAGAEVAIIGESSVFSLRADLQGRFSITLRGSESKLRVKVEHPDYLPVEQKITLGKNREVFLSIELTPRGESYCVAAGTVDYALPEIPAVPLPALFDAHFGPLETEAWDEEPWDIIVEPYVCSEEAALAIGRDIGAEGSRLFLEAGIVVFSKPEEVPIDQFLSEARAHPLVKAADIDYPVFPLAAAAELQLAAIPNDPEYNRQWNLAAVYLPFAWLQVERRATVRIAVLDTLISADHPDLQQNLNLQDAYNVVDQSSDVRDDFHRSGRPEKPPYSHGTHVIGIIGATADNAKGVAGAVWGADVEIIPIVVLGKDNRSSLSHVIAGIDKAIELGVDLINMSLGANLSSPHTHMLYAKIQEADAAGITMVAAAGNGGKLLYPAGYDEVIAVGATTSQHQITYYSAADGVRLFAPGGEELDPGKGVYSTDLVEPNGDGYSVGRGTSMATPLVTAIAALVKSTYPNITKDDLEELLWSTGIVFDPERPGQRLVNAYAAVTNTPVKKADVVFSNLDTGGDYAVELDQDRYFHKLLPPGLYRVTAHIDANQDQMVNPGEWYYESEIVLEPDKHVSGLQIRLDIYR